MEPSNPTGIQIAIAPDVAAKMMKHTKHVVLALIGLLATYLTAQSGRAFLERAPMAVDARCPASNAPVRNDSTSQTGGD